MITDVCDFFVFLQFVLGFVRRRFIIVVLSYKFKVSLIEVNSFEFFFDKLFGLIDICLNKMDYCLRIQGKKDDDFNRSGWYEYFVILRELSNILVFYSGFEDKFWIMMRQYKVVVRGLIVSYVKRSDDCSWFFNYKDVLDFESRRYLAMLMFLEVREDYEELYEMLIDRFQLLVELFEYILRVQSFLLYVGFFMEFKNEEVIGLGVLREWFCLVC